MYVSVCPPPPPPPDTHTPFGTFLRHCCCMENATKTTTTRTTITAIAFHLCPVVGVGIKLIGLIGPRTQFYRPWCKLTGNMSRPKLFPIGPRTQFYRPWCKLTGNLSRPKLFPIGPRTQFYRPWCKLTGNLSRPKLFPVGPRTSQGRPQCTTTGVTKAVVCAILSVGWVHIKEPLLLIGKSSPCGGSGFPLSISEWFFTICPTPYNRKKMC